MRRGGGVGRRLLLTGVVPLVSAGVARHAAAEVKVWNNPAGGVFQEGGNWLPAVAPTPEALAVFNLAPQPYAVRLNADASLGGFSAGGGDMTLDLGGYGLTVAASGTADTTRLGYVSGRPAVVRVVGGTLTTLGPAVMADAEGTAADVFLKGPAAHWAAGELTVGQAGAARLELSGGALLTGAPSSTVAIGDQQSARGGVVLSGPGTRWETDGRVLLGGREIWPNTGGGGEGTLSVLDGAAMVQRTYFGIDLASALGSTGRVVVSGVNGATRSSLQARSLTVGVRGSGTMVVGDGARVETGVATVGDISGSAGEVVVAGRAGGFDAELLPGFLRVGSATIGGARPYTGRVNVNAGGVVRAQRIEIGSDARGTGTVTVDGGLVQADEVWLTAGDVNVRDGVFATRTLLLRSAQVIRPANFTQSGGLVTGLPGASGAPTAGKVQIGDNGRPGGPYDLRGGTLRATVTVDPLGRFTHSGGTIDGTVENRGTFTVEAPAGATAPAGGGSVVTGQFTNPGTVHVTSGSVHFDGGYSGFVGTFINEGGRVEATEFVSGGTCVVRLAAGTEVSVSRRFSGSATNPANWDTSGATLHFSNASPNRAGYTMSAPGVDLGATAAGYVRNFAWEALHLDAGDSLTLSGTGPAVKHAVYVRELLLDGGTFQAGSISSSSFSAGVNVYYDANNPANAYLGGKTYAGGPGVVIMPVLPEPAAAGVLILPAAVMLRRRRHLSHSR